MILWQAKLDDEETKEINDETCDRMIEELEEAWERIKDKYIRRRE